MKKLILVLAIVGLLLVVVGSTQAAVITFDNPDLSAWRADRYDPAVFTQTYFDGDYRLQLGLRAEDNEAGRSGTSNSSDFYNYQGRYIDTPNNPAGTYVSVDMYADSGWNAGTRAGMWATASNGNLSYPIIEFCVLSDSGDGSSDFTGFRWWQSGTGWTEGIEMDADNEWHNLKIVLGDTDVSFYVDGDLLGTSGNLGADSIDNVILQGHNQGLAGEYDIYYDNFTHGEAIPEPASIVVWGLLGAGCMGGAIRRRRRRAAWSDETRQNIHKIIDQGRINA